eukprot:TRINITY_DN5733_c0_g1_i1.p1 TRINITY_DN5733_c0_g1~~TRINITY_DN5733_c0_g1_i1.p1  ORF type:complete len:1490 (-),score=519.65 TRINITY_DN5733_c0_g1_i1:58-4527(-)
MQTYCATSASSVIRFGLPNASSSLHRPSSQNLETSCRTNSLLLQPHRSFFSNVIVGHPASRTLVSNSPIGSSRDLRTESFASKKSTSPGTASKDAKDKRLKKLLFEEQETKGKKRKESDTPRKDTLQPRERKKENAAVVDVVDLPKPTKKSNNYSLNDSKLPKSKSSSHSAEKDEDQSRKTKPTSVDLNKKGKATEPKGENEQTAKKGTSPDISKSPKMKLVPQTHVDSKPAKSPSKAASNKAPQKKEVPKPQEVEESLAVETEDITHEVTEPEEPEVEEQSVKTPLKTLKTKTSLAKKGKASKQPEVEEQQDVTPQKLAEPEQVIEAEVVETQTTEEPSSVEDVYEKKTPVEHVLLRPDTYIGGIERMTATRWAFDSETSRIVSKECTYPPGLFKIFDEILVNASDNKQRDPKGMSEIRVDIDKENNTISVFNNGKGIPVMIHKSEGVYVPELILGNLFTGSNFNDKIIKVTGGRNGYGAKLTNIFSKEFTVETLESQRRLSYKQTWTNNMSEKGEPVVTKVNKSDKDFTRITFKPDLERFGMNSLAEGDILSVMERRVHDIAGCNESVRVFLNGKELANSFEAYLNIYNINDSNRVTATEEGAAATSENAAEAPAPRVFVRENPRWQIGVGVSASGQFMQVSFVNSINTARGGTHVNYIADQIAKYLLEVVSKKEKDLQLNVNHIKNQLAVFVNCLIENPAFDSQTKETLTTKISHFGSECVLKKSFLQEIVDKTGIVDYILSWARLKQQAELARKIKPAGKTSVLGIAKLYDANLAGSERSQQCSLIITEGDSAKALAVAGLSVLGRDSYGVYPLRGKLLNVSEAHHRQLMANAEIHDLIVILGLDYDKKYTTAEERNTLRYGKLMLMTDQDHDGSHIKGLVINFLHHFWPALLEKGDFLEEFITPIVKVTKAKHPKQVFFTIPEYENWKKSLGEDELKHWRIKYYKGLGTSTTEEAKEYFSDLKKHKFAFRWASDSSKLVEMAFHKDKVALRKDWLLSFKDNTYVDHSKSELTVSDFINKELILFSRADNVRSIPSVVDGLKPGQRKVLFACFKRNLKHEIKVAQLAGYVSEQTAYHHGEVSLHSTIINMAQNFVGSNNIPLLYPSGQFGTRLQGGKDAASARYLFTKLSPITRKIFPEADDPLLNYLDDDGISIQPDYFVPIIPMALVNGASGIGSGWSTDIPTYNPIEIVDNLLRKLDGEQMTEMIPWANGYNGVIEKNPKSDAVGTFITKGIIEKQNPTTLVIKELPLQTWVDDYKELLDSMTRVTFIKSYSMQHTSDNSVRFSVKIPKENSKRVDRGLGPIHKFKLERSISATNMHLFDANGVLKKYATPLDIIEDFFTIRMSFYQKRRSFLLAKLEKEMTRISNVSRFCSVVAEGKFKIGNRTKIELFKDLEKLKFQKDSHEGYDYLLNMPIYSLTQEKIQRLQKDSTAKQQELNSLKKTTAVTMWKNELTDLRRDLQRVLKISSDVDVEVPHEEETELD